MVLQVGKGAKRSALPLDLYCHSTLLCPPNCSKHPALDAGKHSGGIPPDQNSKQEFNPSPAKELPHMARKWSDLIFPGTLQYVTRNFINGFLSLPKLTAAKPFSPSSRHSIKTGPASCCLCIDAGSLPPDLQPAPRRIREFARDLKSSGQGHCAGNHPLFFLKQRKVVRSGRRASKELRYGVVG